VISSETAVGDKNDNDFDEVENDTLCEMTTEDVGDKIW